MKFETKLNAKGQNSEKCSKESAQVASKQTQENTEFQSSKVQKSEDAVHPK